MRLRLTNIGDDGLKVKDYIPAIESAGIIVKKEKGDNVLDPNEKAYFVEIDTMGQLMDLRKAVDCGIYIYEKSSIGIVDGDM